MSGSQRRLTGSIHVALPPAEAFCLFTPRGEEAWAHGWHPHFPVPAEDDTAPGTVFETTAHGDRTVWIVTARQSGEYISYARVTPGDRAGTVTVSLSAADRDTSQVEVTYLLTALSDAGRRKLTEFADGYPAFLRSWEDAISAWLRQADGTCERDQADAAASCAARSTRSR